MDLGRVSRRVAPTLWGFSTITWLEHPALVTVTRVDTVLVPVLTPEEFAAFHRHVREGDVACRRRSSWRDDRFARKARAALRGGVDLSIPRGTGERGRAGEVSSIVLDAIAHTVTGVNQIALTAEAQPLARELLWCVITAAQVCDFERAREGVLALWSLADREQVGHVDRGGGR